MIALADTYSRYQALKKERDRLFYIKQSSYDEKERRKKDIDRAAEAYDNHNGEAAKDYANEGHELKDRLHDINAEIRSLGDEVKSAKVEAQSLTGDNTAWSQFNQLKNQFESLKPDRRITLGRAKLITPS